MIRKFLCSIGYHTFDNPTKGPDGGIGSFETECNSCGKELKVFYRRHKIFKFTFMEYYYGE